MQKELNDMIQKRLEAIKKYDNILRLAVKNGDDVKIVEELLEKRNAFINEVIALKNDFVI